MKELYTTKVTMEVIVTGFCTPEQAVDTIEHALNFPTIGSILVKKIEIHSTIHL